MAERAIELLNLEEGSFVLDIGCGSGISGETLTENNYIWEGMDISRDMLDIAATKFDMVGGLMQVDIGQGWKVRPGVFDGAISISTIQWLCVASKKHYNPFKRCCKFFQSLY
jgi:18S rRNA (guanine1575-N7)-methyltransferase